MTTWRKPETKRGKKFKIFIYGPPGCFKTRVGLRLGCSKNQDAPTLGVIDTEFGTDHYVDQFSFVVPPIKPEEMNSERIHQEVEKVVKNPGSLRTLMIDSTSVYMDMVKEHWLDLFQLREKTSAGNKGEYYTIQPRDNDHINRYVGRFVRMLLKCDLNIIATAQKKNEWENMKVIGETFDAWKRLPYYFDTIIEISENKKRGGEQWVAEVVGKDRSHKFSVGEKIPWTSDAAAYEYIVKKIGHDLSGGSIASGYDPEADKTMISVPSNLETLKKPEPKPELKPAQPEPAKSESVSQPEPPTQPQPETQPESSSQQEAAVSEPPAETAPQDDKPATMETLKEVVRVKKEAKINDPDIWLKMVQKYTDKNGNPLASARDMTEQQAKELIKDVLRGEIPT